MTRYWIQAGDTTSGGGSVLAQGAGGDGRPRWARIGDAVHCGMHGMTTIVTGDAEQRIDGRAVARHGDFCACGCILISLSQIRSIVELGTDLIAPPHARRG
ncbi:MULTISPECIES: PAAR domain-containing protein [Lysobacter]|jgi:uncharacterized Zn-binding protein involved in type VI secretion|uniref:PAAR motif family protein n=2 Tax=Lysobacter TaxID=68 RepID=A0A0S2DFM8_LYSEN|nr:MULTISPECIES: PAAR domain-containing protein [Lysobacter]ALN57396.1 PAAR motif family protein [Lysobacter enzymogenes]QQP99418.1 PAAR domain-containing protein [Lysobacter enzymogenes]UZW58868.1 PAAR domain-containing protein [Lysobacter enzymogenes]WMT02589.1 PAAR domain-containing protein [Lysobacter yananisis]